MVEELEVNWLCRGCEQAGKGSLNSVYGISMLFDTKESQHKHRARHCGHRSHATKSGNTFYAFGILDDLRIS